MVTRVVSVSEKKKRSGLSFRDQVEVRPSLIGAISCPWKPAGYHRTARVDTTQSRIPQSMAGGLRTGAWLGQDVHVRERERKVQVKPRHTRHSRLSPRLAEHPGSSRLQGPCRIWGHGHPANVSQAPRALTARCGRQYGMCPVVEEGGAVSHNGPVDTGIPFSNQNNSPTWPQGPVDGRAMGTG